MLLLGVLGASGVHAARRRCATTRRRGHDALLKAAWTDPRTLVVGLMVLAFAFTEGVANDWTAVAVVDGLT